MFLLRFNDAFDDQLLRELTLGGPQHDTALAKPTRWDSLSLVDDSEMDAQISIDRMGMEIGFGCEWELRDLDGYVSALLGQADSPLERNPCGPKSWPRRRSAASPRCRIARDPHRADGRAEPLAGGAAARGLCRRGSRPAPCRRATAGHGRTQPAFRRRRGTDTRRRPRPSAPRTATRPRAARHHAAGWLPTFHPFRPPGRPRRHADRPRRPGPDVADAPPEPGRARRPRRCRRGTADGGARDGGSAYTSPPPTSSSPIGRNCARRRAARSITW